MRENRFSYTRTRHRWTEVALMTLLALPLVTSVVMGQDGQQRILLSQADTLPEPNSSSGNTSSGESNIAPIRPSQSTLQQRTPDSRRVPFQHRLPDELQPKPVTAEAKRQQDRFVPQIIDPQQELNLIVGHPRILTFAKWATKPQVRLYLADESIMRWDIISDTEVAVVGLQPGTTVLTIWFNDSTTDTGKRVLSFRVRVFEDPQFRDTLDDIEKQIAELFPDSYVQLSVVRDRLVVRGQAKDAIEAGQILTVLAQTRSERGGGRHRDSETRTTNVYVDQDEFRMAEESAVRRSVIDPTAIAQSGIINLLTIPGEQQVTLRITLAEVNRSALRSIGTDMEIGGSGDISFVSLLLPNGIAPATGGNLLVNKPDFRMTLNALRTLGFARIFSGTKSHGAQWRSGVIPSGRHVPCPKRSSGVWRCWPECKPAICWCGRSVCANDY